MVQPVPEGFHSVSPHLTIRNAADAVEFYKKAFAAEELCRMTGPDGKAIMHCEIKIGNSVLMIAEEFPDMGMKSPQALQGSPVTLHLYVADVDDFFQRAVAAGATPTMPVMDQFWGDRYGRLQDPFGHQWSVATHKEDLTPEEIDQRAAKWFAEHGGEKC